MSDFPFFEVLFISSSLFGLVTGAYYGTIEYRIRRNLPLITSDCFCPCCGHVLPLHHQIPILSFFLLKGKCRFCHTPIPVRYPLTESGFLFYYIVLFVIFFRMPTVYLALWYIFICILLLVRCQRQYRSLLKGIVIMTLYHVVIAVTYIAVYLASYNTLLL